MICRYTKHCVIQASRLFGVSLSSLSPPFFFFFVGYIWSWRFAWSFHNPTPIALLLGTILSLMAFCTNLSRSPFARLYSVRVISVSNGHGPILYNFPFEDEYRKWVGRPRRYPCRRRQIGGNTIFLFHNYGQQCRCEHLIRGRTDFFRIGYF